jgi:drug/metabolite transporter (DMT)-like permease
MVTTVLYALVVLIWGSTWIAVHYQVGIVPPEASVAYRIGLAAVFMFVWALLRRLPLRFSLKDHFFMAMQGVLIFSTNFFLFYHAAVHLTTGLIAVIFSTASVMIIFINALLLRRWPSGWVIAGALIGVLGIGIIFNRELLQFSGDSDKMLGLVFSVGGTLSFSLGSIVSARNRRAGLSVCGNTFWAMLYGALLLTFFLLISGNSFTFDFRLPYTLSLLYLSIVGSVIAFAAYFALLGRIETERAAYATVLFPIVALSLSTLFEGYNWTLSAFIGIAIILMGNILVLRVSQSPGKTSTGVSH